MKLSDLDDVVMFRNHREKCLALMNAANSSPLQVQLMGFDDPASHISLECVRRAIQEECCREIENYEAKLKELGVEL